MLALSVNVYLHCAELMLSTIVNKNVIKVTLWKVVKWTNSLCHHPIERIESVLKAL